MDPNKAGEYLPPSEFNNKGSTPLIQNSIPAVAKNQTIPNPSEIDNLQAALKSSSKYVYCPYCKKQNFTKIEKNCSFPNIFCSAITVLVLWVPFQLCRGKDLNCSNAKHYCNLCNNVLADYRAC
jgi:hypothetical protein